MTEPEQPDTPALTRRQLRELRNTGSTPVITADDLDAAAVAAEAAQTADEPAAVPAPLPRAAEPVDVSPPPIPDADVDLGVVPLTRRQARQQERIRTASVPVITPEAAAEYAASSATNAPESSALIDEVPDVAETAERDDEQLAEWFAPTDEDVVQEQAPDIEVVPEREPESESDESWSEPDDKAADEPRAVVNPALGESLISAAPVEIDLPPSFDQLLARGATGSIGMPNALILSQTTGDLPIVSPVSATGEVIITGTFNLPEGLGSTGHALGTTDGKDVDAVLIDGELPAHSSPTPIAASAAISTVKSAGEVIRPPAPEKGSRLMLWLAITAGALALALVGVLILAFVNGVF